MSLENNTGNFWEKAERVGVVVGTWCMAFALFAMTMFIVVAGAIGLWMRFR